MSHPVNTELLEVIYNILIEDGCPPDLAASIAYKKFLEMADNGPATQEQEEDEEEVS